MIGNLLSTLVGTLKSSKDTGGETGTTLAKGTGSKFKQILSKIIGTKSTKPVAYVRKGREVTFEKVPFFNSKGEKLSVQTVSKNGQEKTVAKREGRISGVRRGISDPVTLRENMLSRNKGIAQAIPKFEQRAKEHLKNTQILRAGIVSGELETPGNSNGRLLKKLKEEERKEGIVPSEAWLAQVRQHLGKKTTTGQAQLSAIAQAMKKNSGDLTTDKEKNLKDSKVELLDPTKPRVQKFQPQKIDPKTGKPIKETKTELNSSIKPLVSTEPDLKTKAKKSLSKVHYFNKDTVAKEETTKNKDNSKVIGRITIEERKIARTKDTGIENLSKSHDLIKKLKSAPISKSNYSKAESNDSNLKVSSDKTVEKTATDSSKPLHQESSLKDLKKADNSGKSVKVHAAARETSSPSTPKTIQNAVDSVDAATSSNEVKTRENVTRTVVSQVANVNSQNDPKTKRSGRRGKRVENQKGISRKNLSMRVKYEGLSSTTMTANSTENETKPLDDAAQALKNMVHSSSKDNSVIDHKVPVQTQTGTTSQSTSSGNADIAKNIENLQEVLKKLETQAKILTGEGKTTLKVRLKPANLGALTVHIRENGGRYDVAMRAESGDTAKMIENQVHVIREQLSSQGIEVEKFVIDSGAEKNSSFQQQAQNNRESKSGQGTGRQNFNGNTNEQAQEDFENTAEKRRQLNVGTNTVDYVY